MKITALSEGPFSVDFSKVFTPVELDTYVPEHHPAGTTLLSVHPFLVVTSEEVILLDTGLGLSEGHELQLYRSLRREGLEPTQVTKVFLSHLHKDHTGGVGTIQANGTFQFNFPNAIYYVQERELTFALAQKDNPSYHPATLQALALHPNVHFLNEEEGALTPDISFQVTGGHTPYHQTLTITHDGKRYFYGADVLPQKSYIQQNFAYKNDYDGKRARAFRKEYAEQGQDWIFLLCHALSKPIVSYPDLMKK
ncbi:MBL fold metallo-hydrolase [Siphonobacter sp. SORGH_AS_1065]|uniref:MBL fold metallo-hydrolase n=1 Tax=Siphonobacter sp. SORGH_AS_1065 TaxID=3041795 RepID=UPI00278667EA|nr:MBL fold metallo-hydrolase [Siphonobacter sp. SORGH_AS_1065]MDQ1087688.1 glyoxylase-like metal-dependent hydrolase (beta-lactamase superfamily II) [Siphonobacter sp. SORGH_AS_1065]